VGISRLAAGRLHHTVDADELGDDQPAHRPTLTELREEVGLRAQHWVELQAIYPSPGFLSEKVTIFAATDLSAVAVDPDDDEQIEVVRLPLAEIDAALPEIEDAKTLVALLLRAQR
jgi:8-oxo-dGTP pyrophosphatase MutT (NUDIX family)